jgi:hypothetical protein
MSLPAFAQSRLEVAASYEVQRSNGPAGSCGCFTLQGGRGDAAHRLFRSISVAGEFSGVHASSINSSGLQLSMMTYMRGRDMRRWRDIGPVRLHSFWSVAHTDLILNSPREQEFLLLRTPSRFLREEVSTLPFRDTRVYVSSRSTISGVSAEQRHERTK